jgi:regulator of protease activity HflC (stomatin/prohibitin superfamily)
VKSAFEQVQAAEQERSRKINVAQGKSSEITKLAEGEAESRRQGGIIESNRLVSAIQAEALSFTAQLQYYENDSDLFKRRVLSESLIVVMDRANDKFFLPVRRDGSSRVVHLKLNRETVRPPNREVVANDSKR